MTVHDAVRQAKQFVAELYADEKPTNIGLEEVELDTTMSEWVVTVGFSRPWDEPRNSLALLAAQLDLRRSYKVVRISDKTGALRSVRNREATK